MDKVRTQMEHLSVVVKDPEDDGVKFVPKDVPKETEKTKSLGLVILKRSTSQDHNEPKSPLNRIRRTLVRDKENPDHFIGLSPINHPMSDEERTNP